MKLMPDEIRALPHIRTAMEQGPDATAYLKPFPDGGWYWYASGFDGEDMFYGMVVGYEIPARPVRAVRASRANRALGTAH